MEDSVNNRDPHDAHDALPDQGASQDNTTTAASTPDTGSLEHDSRPFEERTRDELRLAAKERNIKGRGSMNKAELIEALQK